MAAPQLQRIMRPLFMRHGTLSASRILSAAGVLAVIHLRLQTPGPDTLSSFPPSACDRKAYSGDAAESLWLFSYVSRQVNVWSAGFVGLQYAAASSPREEPPKSKTVPPGVRYRELMLNEVVANLAGVPVELLVKDVWDQLFHKSGKQYWLDFVFWLRGSLMYKDARKAAIMIARELQTYLYDEAPVNDGAWKAIRRLLEKHLREWWINCPEDPYRVLPAGVWKSLIKVYVDHLEPALRGSPKLKELDELLFDPELKVIRSWTDGAHINIVRGREDEIVSKLDSLARERPRQKRSTQHATPLPISVGPVEQAPAPEQEQAVDVVNADKSSVKKRSRSGKTQRTMRNSIPQKSDRA